MTALEDLNNFYAKVMTCDATSDECPKSWKEPEIGYVPRGFYYESPNIDILTVLKNPGHLMDKEKELYIGKSGLELVEAHKKFYRELIDEPAKRGRFHKKFFEYFTFILDLPINKIYSRLAFTNLFKCSTEDVSPNFGKYDYKKCFEKFFLGEITLYKPKVILALDFTVYKFLKYYGNKEKMGKIVGHEILIKPLKHPSWPLPDKDKTKILLKLKEEINNHLKKI